MNVKWDDKLNNNSKFEQFHDYLSSELRSNGLLHVVESKILINHLDSHYYSKVMHLQKSR